MLANRWRVRFQQNRSAALALGFLIKTQGLSFEQALALAHPCVHKQFKFSILYI